LASMEATNESVMRESQQTMDVLYELSRLLNTGLDRETLGILVSLCENGTNPEALAMVVKELRREGDMLAKSDDA